jgi:hypothetical protein
MSKVTKSYDNDLLLKDAGLVAASAACQVDSADQIIDLGVGLVEGDIVIDVTACEVVTGNEIYRIGAQISSDDGFASDYYEVATLFLGSAGTAIASSSPSSSASSSPSSTASPSASVSSSPSTSPSSSASSSPSSSASPSTSPSSSPSSSPSHSASSSPSSSDSPSASVSSSPSSSASSSPSASTFSAVAHIPGDTNMGVGRYIMKFRNAIADNTTKRYLRLYVTVSGTVATGINFVAYLSKQG